MTSVLNVDTIAAKDGTSAVTLTKQQAAKAWVNFDGTASGAAARDSFNLSGMTDNGTGNYTVTVSSAFSNNNFALAGMGGKATNDQYAIMQPRASSVPTTTATVLNAAYNDTNNADPTVACVAYFGDLA